MPEQTKTNHFQPGIFHFVRESGENKKRLHLRIDADYSGVLIINASQIYHINPSAALMTFYFLQRQDEKTIVKNLEKKFAVSHKQAVKDYAVFKGSLETITSPTEEACPICDLEIDSFSPFSRTPSAPYRMDLALTYRCNNACIHCYNPPSRGLTEMPVSQWKQALDKIWQIGIPHVVFTGGEPTLFPGLAELVAYAENLELITGLNTNGRLLSNRSYLDQLQDAGLDHIQITLESHNPALHDRIVAHQGAWQETVAGIRNAVSSRLYIMTNTTLLKENSPYLEETLHFLADLKVPTVGLNGLIYSGRGAHLGHGIDETELPNLLEVAKAHFLKSGQRLIWYTPTLYCHFNPVESGLGVKGCTAALYNMCVEPDGSVLPCQSYYQPLGNLLTDAWQSIWEHELAVSIRERKYIPKGCQGCDLITTCGAGCPLYLENQPAITAQPMHVLPF